ncbi:MAG TPA: neprosin family prolyl endopeptidase [Streptosporangiales bacterium]
MASPLGILPHDAFRTMVRNTTLNQLRDDPRVRVANRTVFDAMKAHLLDLYADMQVEHSFEDVAGQVIDCVPVEEQPSLRGRQPKSPPDLRPVLRGHDPAPTRSVPRVPVDERRRDRHGNVMAAPEGTIPVRRLTLADLTRSRTLDEFFRKAPGPTSEPPSTPDPDTSKNHRYAYTHQTVDAIGGHSSLALYSPAIDSDQVFSLAQHWYTGGSGDAHQTVEVGWQVFPDHYGHAHPALFVYWTADNYQTTGAYNLDKPGFVQTSNTWTLGGALSPVSTRGGQQFEIEVTTYLFDGDWWIYIGGSAPENAVGYYPGSLYDGGQLTTNATEILYGGETVCKAVSWPDMGSGAFAAAGWQQAAYQRNIYYYPPVGGAQWTKLTPEEPSPACYTLDLESAAAPWGIYFFYGGSGGGNC